MPVKYSNGTGNFIPELSADPVSPIPQTAWVLATPMGMGSPIGLLLSLTYAAPVIVYKLSYQTLEGTTIRTVLS